MRLIWLLLLSWGALAAEFEVASVRPPDPRQSAVDFVISPGGRLRVTNLTPLEMVREAYRMKYRSLLEERFQLKVRREVREGNVYELVVAKGGPKLKASTAESSFLRLYRNTPRELPGLSYTRRLLSGWIPSDLREIRPKGAREPCSGASVRREVTATARNPLCPDWGRGHTACRPIL